MIYKYDGTDFQQVPGALEQISAGADGSVWGLNGDGLIYKYDGNNFVNVPGYLKEISVGNKDNVWGVNKNILTGFADIFKYDGSKFVQVPWSAFRSRCWGRWYCLWNHIC